MDQLKLAELLNDYSVSCKVAGKHHSAKVALQRALALHPTASVLWANLGVVLWNLNEFEDAEIALKKSIELLDNHEDVTARATPYANYGLLCTSLQRWDESEALFKKAISIEKERLNPQWDLSCMYLEKGDWEEGLNLYETRIPFKKFPKFPFPMWDGEDLNGKTIFIQAEQGTGDRILFSRYLFWLKETYPDCKILFLTDSATVSLLWDYRIILEFYPTGVPFPQADYGLYLMSLPKFHGSRPNFVPKDPGFIKKRVAPQASYCNLPVPNAPALKVGISWTGNPEQELNQFRSIPFEKILSLASNPKVVLYSLQVGPGADDVQKFQAGELVCDLSVDLKEKGFVGTAQTLMNLDLVITCCTSIAHLCGVLDVPCWVLLPRNAYWVWLTNREDSIWYPSLKLYRQETPGKWSKLINIVEKDLENLASQKIK